MRTLHHVSSSIMLELVPGLVCVSYSVLFDLPACHLLIHHNYVTGSGKRAHLAQVFYFIALSERAHFSQRSVNRTTHIENVGGPLPKEIRKWLQNAKFKHNAVYNNRRLCCLVGH